MPDVAGAGALVEALVCLLGRELELADRAGEEGRCGLEGACHGDWMVVVPSLWIIVGVEILLQKTPVAPTTQSQLRVSLVMTR